MDDVILPRLIKNLDIIRNRFHVSSEMCFNIYMSKV